MSSAGISSVDRFTEVLKELLERSRRIKPHGGIEPALTSSTFEGEVESITKRVKDGLSANKSQDHYAALETSCRNIFYNLLASTSIEDDSFGPIWDLLDIVSILSDPLLCEPGLVFWLVEELLDSQTIDGCRLIFDYLDSRRERLTAKHFKQKQLIILRACNELLRRLSRAEDTVFCGRVFIFMFQSFPLGDRSSVNLRGEYHVENVTVFEKTQGKLDESSEGAMEIDQKTITTGTESTPSDNPPTATNVEADTSTPQPADTATKSVKIDAQGEKPQETEPDTDTLYPIFWSLQDTFSQPTRLFDTQVFSSFRSGLDLTLRKFKFVQQHQQSRGTSKPLPSPTRPLKRKRSDITSSDHHTKQQLASSFNPRYLTSRDLFELEISDLAFRRHILVQALILVDFLLSLTPKAKRKLEHSSNKSVLYNYTLAEEDIKWATATRAEIATYLQQGQEGKFYYRMVDTVLSRDKNWVHWKAGGCVAIEETPLSADFVFDSQRGAQKTCAPRRIRPTPLGSLDLSFLSNTGDEGQAQGLEALKKPDRYTLPKVEDYQVSIMEDEFDMDMAQTDEEKEGAAEARASKMWRALRIASKSRLNLFDKLEDGKGLEPLFEKPASMETGDENEGTKGEVVENRRKNESVKGDMEEIAKKEVDGVNDDGTMEAVPTGVEAT
ncbi:MAG: hypothetical protein Q9170_003279 [Blastenia crenularia]